MFIGRLIDHEISICGLQDEFGVILFIQIIVLRAQTITGHEWLELNVEPELLFNVDRVKCALVNVENAFLVHCHEVISQLRLVSVSCVDHLVTAGSDKVAISLVGSDFRDPILRQGVIAVKVGFDCQPPLY